MICDKATGACGSIDPAIAELVLMVVVSACRARRPRRRRRCWTSMPRCAAAIEAFETCRWAAAAAAAALRIGVGQNFTLNLDHPGLRAVAAKP